MSPAPRFDAESGALRLSRAAFAALVSHAGGQPIGSPEGRAELLETLEDAGVLVDGVPAPPLAPAVAAAADPVCACAVRRETLAAQPDELAVEGWVGGEAAVLLVPAEGQLVDVVATHPSALPETLARLVGLGPRPRQAVPVRLEVAEGRLDGLLRAGAAPARADVEQLLGEQVADDVVATVGSLAATARSRWQVAVRWQPAAGSVGERTVEVIDTANGLWLLGVEAGTLTLVPVTPTEVWRLLVRLLPRDEELTDR